MTEAALPSRVVLVGFMGSGKTTVGPLVAHALGYDFLDMDQVIETRTGMTVAQIFRERGEGAFRAEERSLALELADRTRLVVAAGGGAFAQPGTRELLRRNAVAVWLRCDLATVLGRLPADGTRPLAESRETIVRLFAEREPSYRQADEAVEASAVPAEEVARRIVGVVRDAARRTMDR